MRYRLLTGDVRERLRELEPGSVQTCVTSPPYWGLRDYGVSGQIGLEPTPDAYVQSLVEVFRLVREALKDDGTLWLNLGDSYNAQPGRRKSTDAAGAKQQTNVGAVGIGSRYVETLKPKDLCMIPARVALALQADGWYLRSDIIWNKRNCMPESVTDRPTRNHEYIFLLTKAARYYYDADAIAEPCAPSTIRQAEELYTGKATKDYSAAGAQDPSAVKARIVAKMNRAPARARAKHAQSEPQAAGRRIVENVAAARALGGPHDNPFGLTRNKRTVWTIATQPYPDAHFATYPEKLIESCILAGCPVGGLVLDPFTGSGTTGAVAIRHQRQFVGIELNPAYVELARTRIGAVAPLFAQEHTA